MYSVLLNTSVVLMFLWLMLYFRNLGQRFTKRRNFFVPMLDVFMYSLPIFIDNNNTLGLKDSDVSEYNKTVKIQIIHFILAPFIISFMLIVMHYEPTIDYQVEQYGVIGYGTVISTDNTPYLAKNVTEKLERKLLLNFYRKTPKDLFQTTNHKDDEYFCIKPAPPYPS